MSTVVRVALHAMDEDTRSAFLAHLEGGTSANYLSDWLKRFGHPTSATTIKTYRASLRKEGGVK